MRSSWVNGKRRLQPAGGRPAQTNDLGQYRIYGLPPGEYYVSGTLRGGGEMVAMEMAMIAGGASGPQPSGSEPRSGYTPTYYPGTPNGGEAQKIVLTVGHEAQNTDFGLLSVKLAKVTGSVIGSDGRPVEGAMINVVPRNASEISFNPLGQGRSDKSGNFTLPSVAPGDYTLRATGFKMAMSGGEGGDQMVFTTRINMGGDGQTEFGSVPLAVTGEDIANVMVVTSKGSSATGRVTWEGGSKPASTPTLRISALATDTDGPRMMGTGGASVTAEGTFEIKGLAGARVIRPVGLPQGWVLKAVRLNGQDISDTGIDVKPGEPVSGLEVVLTSKTTEVNGTVKANNQPANDYTVVIFAEDSQKWTVPMTRHITGARPNQEGRFQVKNMPAGSYYAVALDYIAQGEWNDPEVLERIKAKATRFTLEDGGVETLDLKLSGS
ncbi:MAG TPA: carboxypeptidase-like regulatory domain-containing protein, partial [Vicinamibacterales bacterium]|nr:carboxypeptidase-like regulatory domain-containing protein [Vicinamibacterales bacterium]